MPKQQTTKHIAPTSRPPGQRIYSAGEHTARNGQVPAVFGLAGGPLDAYATSGSSPPAEHPIEQAPFSIEGTQSATVWMTLAEVAEELSVSVRTVMRWVQRGELPAIELPGGRKRVHRQTFNLWLTSLSTADLPALERD